MAKKYLVGENMMRQLREMLRWWRSQADVVFRAPTMEPPPTSVVLRHGKLDADLTVGGKATVSLWHNSSTGSWHENLNADSTENWEDCLGPFIQSATIASGKKVTVLSINGVRHIIGAEC